MNEQTPLFAVSPTAALAGALDTIVLMRCETALGLIQAAGIAAQQLLDDGVALPESVWALFQEIAAVTKNISPDLGRLMRNWEHHPKPPVTSDMRTHLIVGLAAKFNTIPDHLTDAQP